MKSLILIASFFVILFLPLISAEITLSNLTIETNQTWCYGNFIEIQIFPQDIEGNFTDVNNIQIETKIENSNLSYEISPLYKKSNKYISSINISHSLEEIPSENITLFITVNQEGKTVESNKTIEIKESCKQNERTSAFEQFIIQHYLTILISLFGLFLFIIIIKILSIKDK